MKLAKEYRGLTPEETPKTPEDKLQQWILRSAKAAGVDLTEFYLDWGFPVVPAAGELATLPKWGANPMAKYD